MKSFCENAENEFALYQFLMLSVCEVKLFIEKTPEILKEALDSVNWRQAVQIWWLTRTLFQPTDMEEKSMFGWYFQGSQWDCSTKSMSDRNISYGDPNRRLLQSRFSKLGLKRKAWWKWSGSELWSYRIFTERAMKLILCWSQDRKSLQSACNL